MTADTLPATAAWVHHDGPDPEDDDLGHWFCCDPQVALCGARSDEDMEDVGPDGPDPQCPLCNLIRDEDVPCRPGCDR